MTMASAVVPTAITIPIPVILPMQSQVPQVFVFASFHQWSVQVDTQRMLRPTQVQVCVPSEQLPAYNYVSQMSAADDPNRIPSVVDPTSEPDNRDSPVSLHQPPPIPLTVRQDTSPTGLSRAYSEDIAGRQGAPPAPSGGVASCSGVPRN